jgi:hypothetical protein
MFSVWFSRRVGLVSEHGFPGEINTAKSIYLRDLHHNLITDFNHVLNFAYVVISQLAYMN